MSADPNCIFCKIVAGQIPALRVFEDDGTLAFLDIGPLAEGHLLVVPKEHYARVEDMPPDKMAALARHFPRLVRAVVGVTSAEGCNLLLNNEPVAGQEVPHVHWHVIPRSAADGLGFRWKPSKYATGRGEVVQQLVKDALS
ncbi:MAG: HIT family protein [Phycisphaerae bacterium]|nr:HIT family protein [Phycisphaerae bacterium]